MAGMLLFLILAGGLGLGGEDKGKPASLDQVEKHKAEHEQAQRWMKQQAGRLEQGNVVLRTNSAEVERLTAQLEAATKELQALAQEQARRHASRRWWKPWSWNR